MALRENNDSLSLGCRERTLVHHKSAIRLTGEFIDITFELTGISHTVSDHFNAQLARRFVNRTQQRL
jgi:hypothetical protein